MLKLKPKTFHGNSVLVMKLLAEFLMCSMQFLIKKREKFIAGYSIIWSLGDL